MTKKTTIQKEPVKLREKKLANGNVSLYLDIYRNGKRQKEYLKLYLPFRNILRNTFSYSHLKFRLSKRLIPDMLTNEKLLSLSSRILEINVNRETFRTS